MPFMDIPTDDPYLRLFYNGAIKNIVFSAHGIWNPAKYGMTRVTYTYYWYTQPSQTLTGEKYIQKITDMGAAEPVDKFGPGSGEVANMLLIPLEQKLFTFTATTFVHKIKAANPNGLALLAFHGNKAVPAMTLKLLDTQLLPALKYPESEPVHMVVCRSLMLNQVAPLETKEGVILTSSVTPFNKITTDK